MLLTGFLRWFRLQREVHSSDSFDGTSTSYLVHCTNQLQQLVSHSSTATARVLQQQQQQQPEEPRETVDLIKGGIIILVCGVAMVLALVAVTYWISKLADLCDSRRRRQGAYPWHYNNGEDEDMDRGSLSRKANLWGLRRSERWTILQELLKSTTKTYDSSCYCSSSTVAIHQKNNLNNEDKRNEMVTGAAFNSRNPGDIEMGVTSKSSTSVSASESEPLEAEEENRLKVKENVDGETALTRNRRDVSFSDDAQEHGPTTNELDTLTQHIPPRQESTDDIMDDEEAVDYEKLCSICLSEYKDGEAVLTGTQCVHLFHTTCCQNWLAQNDLCPCCRKEIVRPSEFRATAVTLLGERRVQSLSGPNVEPDLPTLPRVDSSNAISSSAARSSTSIDTITTSVGYADSEHSDDEVRI